MAGIDFNAKNVDPSTEFKPLPAGDYQVIVTTSKIGPTKAGTGTIITFKLKVMDGPEIDKVLFDRINYKNANPQAQEIGQQNLSALCHAVGVLEPEDTEQLHNIPFMVAVAVKISANYGAQNEIKGRTALVLTGDVIEPQQEAATGNSPKPAWG